MSTKTFCIAVILLWVNCAFAQDKKSDGGASASTSGTKGVTILYFPEFYHYGSTRVGDTTFAYECYDHNDRLLRGNALQNTDSIEEIFFVKSYTDSRYPGGENIRPPVFTKKALAYTKADKHSWIEKNMADQSTKELTAYPDKITRCDTTIVVGPHQMIIRRYYMVK